MYMGKPEILVGKAIMVPGLIHIGQPSFHMSRVKSSCQTVTAIVNQFYTMNKNFEALSYGCIGSWGQFNKTFTSVIYTDWKSFIKMAPGPLQINFQSLCESFTKKTA